MGSLLKALLAKVKKRKKSKPRDPSVRDQHALPGLGPDSHAQPSRTLQLDSCSALHAYQVPAIEHICSPQGTATPPSPLQHATDTNTSLQSAEAPSTCGLDCADHDALQSPVAESLPSFRALPDAPRSLQPAQVAAMQSALDAAMHLSAPSGDISMAVVAASQPTCMERDPAPAVAANSLQSLPQPPAARSCHTSLQPAPSEESAGVASKALPASACGPMQQFPRSAVPPAQPAAAVASTARPSDQARREIQAARQAAQQRQRAKLQLQASIMPDKPSLHSPEIQMIWPLCLSSEHGTPLMGVKLAVSSAQSDVQSVSSMQAGDAGASTSPGWPAPQPAASVGSAQVQADRGDVGHVLSGTRVCLMSDGSPLAELPYRRDLGCVAGKVPALPRHSPTHNNLGVMAAFAVSEVGSAGPMPGPSISVLSVPEVVAKELHLLFAVMVDRQLREPEEQDSGNNSQAGMMATPPRPIRTLSTSLPLRSSRHPSATPDEPHRTLRPMQSSGDTPVGHGPNALDSLFANSGLLSTSPAAGRHTSSYGRASSVLLPVIPAPPQPSWLAARYQALTAPGNTAPTAATVDIARTSPPPAARHASMLSAALSKLQDTPTPPASAHGAPACTRPCAEPWCDEDCCLAGRLAEGAACMPPWCMGPGISHAACHAWSKHFLPLTRDIAYLVLCVPTAFNYQRLSLMGSTGLLLDSDTDSGWDRKTYCSALARMVAVLERHCLWHTLAVLLHHAAEASVYLKCKGQPLLPHTISPDSVRTLLTAASHDEITISYASPNNNNATGAAATTTSAAHHHNPANALRRLVRASTDGVSLPSDAGVGDPGEAAELDAFGLRRPAPMRSRLGWAQTTLSTQSICSSQDTPTPRLLRRRRRLSAADSRDAALPDIMSGDSLRLTMSCSSSTVFHSGGDRSPATASTIAVPLGARTSPSEPLRDLSGPLCPSLSHIPSCLSQPTSHSRHTPLTDRPSSLLQHPQLHSASPSRFLHSISAGVASQHSGVGSWAAPRRAPMPIAVPSTAPSSQWDPDALSVCSHGSFQTADGSFADCLLTFQYLTDHSGSVPHWSMRSQFLDGSEGSVTHTADAAHSSSQGALSDRLALLWAGGARDEASSGPAGRASVLCSRDLNCSWGSQSDTLPQLVSKHEYTYNWDRLHFTERDPGAGAGSSAGGQSAARAFEPWSASRGQAWQGDSGQVGTQHAAARHRHEKQAADGERWLEQLVTRVVTRPCGDTAYAYPRRGTTPTALSHLSGVDASSWHNRLLLEQLGLIIMCVLLLLCMYW